jgi:hypothetical protein
MSKELRLQNAVAVALAGLALCLATPILSRAQDAQPSLADAARAARKDKDKEKDKTAAAQKAVITEDDLSAGVGVVSSKSGDTTSGPEHASGDTSSLEIAWARLQATEASMDRLEPLGKSELATTVLNGNAADFPNRGEWEEQLYAAKGIYIQRSRKLIEAMKQVLANMAALQGGSQGKVADNDPRILAMTRKTKQIMQLAAATESEFQQVVVAGKNLSLQTPRQ